MKTNIVGLAVLGFGVLAALIVGILAYQTLAPSGEESRQQQVSKEEIKEFKQTPLFQEGTRALRQQPKPSYERQKKSISEKQIVGSWDTRINEGRALLQLQGGTYRLIIVMDNPAASRWYSNGTYIMQDDILILEPNLKWGPPKSRKYGYRVLSKSKMPVMVSKHKGKMVWQVPGPEANIYVPNYHPLLSLTQDKIAVWGVLK